MAQTFSLHDALPLLSSSLEGSPQRRSHSLAVATYTYDIALKLVRQGYDVDPNYVKAVALVHDIGHGLLAMKGSIEEHALVELALLQRLGFSDVGYLAASDFATHEGMLYALHHGFSCVPVNSRKREYLKANKFPVSQTASGFHLDLRELVNDICLPGDGHTSLGHTLEKAIADEVFVPQTLEAQIVTYADAHLTQGVPYSSDSLQDTYFLVGLPNGELYSVKHGSFANRVREIGERFANSDDPNCVKIRTCVEQAQPRIQRLIDTLNSYVGIEAGTYVPPQTGYIIFETTLRR